MPLLREACAIADRDASMKSKTRENSVVSDCSCVAQYILAGPLERYSINAYTLNVNG